MAAKVAKGAKGATPADDRRWWHLLPVFAFMALMVLSRPAAALDNFTNVPPGNVSINPVPLFGQGIQITGGGLEERGGQPMLFAGLVLLLIFAFMLFRWGQSMDFLFAFAVPFLFLLGIHGFLPFWMAIFIGGASFMFFVWAVLNTWAR